MAAAIAQAQRITAAQAKDTGATYAQTVDDYALSARSAVAVTVLSLLVAAAVGISLVRAISAPLRYVIELSEAIAAGDLTRSIEIRSRDEIGQMTAGLARMQDGIQRMVADVRQTTEMLLLIAEELATEATPCPNATMRSSARWPPRRHRWRR